MLDWILSSEQDSPLKQWLTDNNFDEASAHMDAGASPTEYHYLIGNNIFGLNLEWSELTNEKIDLTQSSSERGIVTGSLLFSRPGRAPILREIGDENPNLDNSFRIALYL